MRQRCGAAEVGRTERAGSTVLRWAGCDGRRRQGAVGWAVLAALRSLPKARPRRGAAEVGRRRQWAVLAARDVVVRTLPIAVAKKRADTPLVSIE